MRLKKIKLAGFKSFVDPTSIPFPGEMTAIVGPNGCGKSNVIDAVRWVLGESSAKNLRGDAMTDVIFNGSSARKPVGQCSVELVFDNSSGRIEGEFAKYNELSIKRLVTRDATSTYFLNGTKCRRRDVTDLFLGTGLGPRSYAIIEQGMISRLIESKPQDLRVFIEEAAGVSRYKERRRETENRIRHTVENLERLEDVRGELAQQIEKLQRQAAAANRYKTLKASERTLKAELSVIRWLKHSQKMEKLNQQKQKQETELEALIAQQRGDEAGIVKYQQKADELTQSLDDLQQKRFSTGTAITRIEQSNLHSQQRKSQISTELSDLTHQIDEIDHAITQASQAKDMSADLIRQLEPENEMLTLAIEQAEEQKVCKEAELREFNQHTRNHEAQYHQLKNQVQTCHSQLQALMDMQLRTTQRIGEVEEELREIEGQTLQTEVNQLEAECTQKESEISYQRGQVKELLLLKERAETTLAEHQNVLSTISEQINTVKASISAIETMQTERAAAQGTNENLTSIWQQVEVASGYEKCFEVVLEGLSQPLVSQAMASHAIPAEVASLPLGQRVVAFDAVKQDVEKGSLAERITAGPHYEFFNHIFIVDTLEEANRKLDSLLPHQTVITKQGQWLSHSWAINQHRVQGEGSFAQTNRLRELNEQSQGLMAKFSEQKEQCAAQQQQLSIHEETLAERQHALNELLTAQQALQNDAKFARMRWENSEQRRRKLTDELTRQQERLEEEKLQQEEVSIKLEEASLKQVELEEQNQKNDEKRELIEAAIVDIRQNLERQISQRHQIELSLQQQKSQYELYTQQVTRNEMQRENLRNRCASLENERENLSAPMATQQAQLQELLTMREELEALISQRQSDLNEMHKLLQEAKQGQHGIMEQINQRQATLESLRLEVEGYRVRAAAVIEQLQDTGQNLKAVLETLDEHAEESTWQSELESTQAAISRLGAVNLAAVDEFEVQSERKHHLDTQFEDLNDALDTLRSAIRKIDKETRQRFAETFEQVNNDLKTLFPKVFGGGSAYLALTDDDYLETGVTIMARPPGKKNSTIHLLSGGEKALTALSLVFAIFRLNPAPFCLLDEVDAPLDDANVGRFCNLVSEMSQTVQFIYITHNKIAMEMASHLTGVTMAEPGVSRMVAVDVDEAISFAET
ncbi:chromosome segregation protein SMC [Alteromonas ponticola]|uniref:Chromosome partition protein Smc n=1 Tax=Alteromonas aquimaris TaxID=2998417 RepID=A0ABT3P917_9ALTE|nr:chromosome segregation protein SMC [Alteromonas aquimaris]MCW8108586.1 chromosome segregation protein SMC [Alteromonas aquimaris]